MGNGIHKLRSSGFPIGDLAGNSNVASSLNGFKAVMFAVPGEVGFGGTVLRIGGKKDAAVGLER